jgi:hypothetical protein
LVFVLVNGVASFSGPTASGWTTSVNNQLTFNTALQAGTIVTISVYSAPPTFTIAPAFTLNQNLTSTVSGSWSNIRWVQEYDPNTGSIKPNNWWLYTCNATDLFSKSSRLSFVGTFTDSSLTVPFLPTVGSPSDFSYIRFLLASPPFDSVDRYLNFYVDGSLIGKNYSLLTTTSTITELFADTEALTELYPPFQLQINIAEPELSSFITPDTYPQNDGVTGTVSSLTSSKIIGPT